MSAMGLRKGTRVRGVRFESLNEDDMTPFSKDVETVQTGHISDSLSWKVPKDFKLIRGRQEVQAVYAPRQFGGDGKVYVVSEDTRGRVKRWRMSHFLREFKENEKGHEKAYEAWVGYLEGVVLEECGRLGLEDLSEGIRAAMKRAEVKRDTVCLLFLWICL